MNGESRPEERPQTPDKKSSDRVSQSTDRNGQARAAEQLMLGQVIRDEGVSRADAGTDDWWRQLADAAIAELARRGVIFQAADLDELGLPPADHPNRMGARFLAAARAGVIRPVGYAPSKRLTTACSAVRLWQGVPR